MRFLHFIFLIPSFLSAQGELPYLNFSLQGSGENVEISWTIQNGFSCEDVEIWRSTDSLNLEKIYTRVGICGDGDSITVYDYIDAPKPVGKKHFYQIRVFSDRTETKSILVPPENGIALFPNPAAEKLNLIYNPQNQLIRFEIFTENGKSIFKTEEVPSEFSLSLKDWQSGVYVYRAVFEDGEFIGKFLKI